MYQTTIKGDKRYHSFSEGYGAPVELFGYTEDGETPMSWVNIALAFCITMCLTSYFKLKIHLPENLAIENEDKLLAFVDEFCRVKKLFREDIVVDISLAP